MLLNKAAAAIAQGLAGTSTANATDDNNTVQSITIFEISTEGNESTSATNATAAASGSKSTKTPSKSSAAIATPSPTDPGATLTNPSDPASATNDDDDDNGQLSQIAHASSKATSPFHFPSGAPPLMTKGADDDEDYLDGLSSDEEFNHDYADYLASSKKRKAGKAAIPAIPPLHSCSHLLHQGKRKMILSVASSSLKS